MKFLILNIIKKKSLRTIGININLQDYIYLYQKELLRCKVMYDKMKF